MCCSLLVVPDATVFKHPTLSLQIDERLRIVAYYSWGHDRVHYCNVFLSSRQTSCTRMCVCTPLSAGLIAWWDNLVIHKNIYLESSPLCPRPSGK